MRTWACLGKFSYLSVLCASLVCNASQAAMYVYPMETAIGENGASQIRVISNDNDVQFVKIKLKKILSPATKQEREVDADMSDVNQIIVTPQKIALSAGGERIVRLVSMNLPAKETTWRVYFEGVSKNAFDSYSIEPKKAANAAEIGVNIIWGALVHVAPLKAVASLKYSPSTGKVINDGTIRIPVKEVGVCNSASECKWEKKTLTFYPDSELSIPGVNFARGNTYKIKYFNWIKNTTEEMELPMS
jgi:P pilus assembly chaperone PapD